MLDKHKIDYAFIDLDEGKKEGFFDLDKKIEVPTLLLVQTIVSDVISGLDEINDVLIFLGKTSNRIYYRSACAKLFGDCL